MPGFPTEFYQTTAKSELFITGTLEVIKTGDGTPSVAAVASLAEVDVEERLAKIVNPCGSYLIDANLLIAAGAAGAGSPLGITPTISLGPLPDITTPFAYQSFTLQTQEGKFD